MRTTVDIDERLLAEVMRLLNVRTKKEAIRRSLENLIQTKRRELLRKKLGQTDLALTLEELEKLREDEA